MPSEPTKTPSRSGPLVVARERDERAVGEDDVGCEHVVDREAVLQAVRSTRVLGDVAADRADLLARRIRGVVVPAGRDRLRDLEVRHPGLDDRTAVLEIDLEHAVQPGQRDHDPVGHRQRPAGKTGAGTTRDERNAMGVAEPDDGLDVVGVPWNDDELWNRAVPGERVALVGSQPLGLADDRVGRQGRRDGGAKLGRQRHAVTIVGRARGQSVYSRFSARTAVVS